jgi:predicted nucleic acid-binding protein
MAYLVDTNILVRLANAADPSNAIADRAVLQLHRQGETIYITAQNLVEFRSVATRPKYVNGLGMSLPDTDAKAAEFEAVFPLLPETADIFPAWKAVVSAVGVKGKQVHDARLVAVCHVHKVTHLLTFNTTHFLALAAFGPGIMIVEPTSV